VKRLDNIRYHYVEPGDQVEAKTLGHSNLNYRFSRNALIRTGDENGGTTHDSWRQSLRLQAAEQQPLTMLQLLRSKNRRASTKEESLSKAKEIAEGWHLQLRGKLRTGELKAEKTFREVSEHFLREYDIMTQGQRNKHYVDVKHWRSSVYLVPFFGNMDISKITTGKIVEYRIHRHQQAIAKRGKPPANSTMHQEIVTLRQTLKTALRHGWLDRLPDFSEPYRLSSKISYRPSFSPSLIAPVRNPLPSEGSKQVNLGRTRFIYDTSRFLLTAVDLPIVSWVAEATEEVP